MNDKDFLEAKQSCYSLAHTIAVNSMMQDKLINELRDCEITIIDKTQVIKMMLKVLISNFTYDFVNH